MMDDRDVLAATALMGMLAHSRGEFGGHIDRRADVPADGPPGAKSECHLHGFTSDVLKP